MRVKLFVVRGRDAPQTIQFEAPTLDDAHRRATEQGFAVLSHRAASSGLLGSWFRSHPPASARVDGVIFVEQLRDLLTAGLSVVEALNTIRATADDGRRAQIERLGLELREGARLSHALEASGSHPPLLVALVRASEQTSNLTQALNRFLEHEKRFSELKHRLVSVAIYPLILLAVGFGVLMFLLLWVVPKFARVFEGMSETLPWSASVMVWWAQCLREYDVALTAGLAGALLMAVALTLSTRARSWGLAQIQTWGPVGRQLRIYFLARWYGTTGMLIQSGIPLPEALSIASNVLPLAMRPAGAATERALRDGLNVAQAYAAAGMTTPVAEQLMRAGERVGDLGTVLLRIAQFHESEVERRLERGMKSLEPLVMVFIGLGVGALVVLMYLPIFELAATIQ